MTVLRNSHSTNAVEHGNAADDDTEAGGRRPTPVRRLDQPVDEHAEAGHRQHSTDGVELGRVAVLAARHDARRRARGR